MLQVERFFRQCRNKLNIFNLFRLCRKDKISFDIVAVCGNKVECCFDKVDSCFDIVAGVDEALDDEHVTATTSARILLDGDANAVL